MTPEQDQLLRRIAGDTGNVYEAVFNGSSANGRKYPAIVEALRLLPGLNWSATVGRGENRQTLSSVLVATHRATIEAAALREALTQVAGGQPIDYDRIAQIVRDNSPDAVDVTVTVDDKTKES